VTRAMTRKSRIGNPIEFGRDGKQVGYLRLPHSVHRSAYGHIPIPIVHIARGEGPRVLLISGNHGDEYEGQIALGSLIRTLEPETVRGSLTILPAANLPAVRAGRRTSPIDDGNLNRSFPGDPDGTPTDIMAHFIESVLMAGMDWVVDVHSGGSSLMYVPTVLTRRIEDPARQARAVEGMRAIGAPFGLVTVAEENRTAMAAAGRQGAIGLTTELGGGATVSPATVGLTQRGLARLLHLIGVSRADPPPPEPTPTRIMRSSVAHDLVYATEPGLFEPLVELGAAVEAGQPAARIHDFEAPWKPPATVRFARAGTVVCKRMPTLTERGDCLFQLATEARDGDTTR
jgi:predicted deacylase